MMNSSKLETKTSDTRIRRLNWRRFRIRLMALPLLCIAFFIGMGWMSQKPVKTGLFQGQLRPLPLTPNCVSSQSPPDDNRTMDPIGFSTSVEEVHQRLLDVLNEYPRMRIKTDEGNYVHAEATSLIFRFVDDVEFLISPSEHVIHFRSASRVGHSDLGANRRRMAAIKKRFEER
ncbi:MAG: DUF1499 domain-containing protein [Pirellulaceae bacterium]